jgi:hypothetical protein
VAQKSTHHRNTNNNNALFKVEEIGNMGIQISVRDGNGKPEVADFRAVFFDAASGNPSDGKELKCRWPLPATTK